VYRALGNDSAARVTDARAAQIAPEYVGLKRPNLKSLNRASQPTSSWTQTPTTGSPTSPSSGSPANGEVFIQAVHMARNLNGKPGEAVLSFPPTDRTIFCVITFNVARAGTRVRFV